MPEKEAEKKPKEAEENVITPEEFEELEEMEAKRKLFGFAKKKEEPKPAKEKREEPKERSSLDSLVLKTEKLEGRIESLEGVRHVFDDRFSRLSEEIGELRSSILEKDKALDRTEAGFRRVKEIFDELEPAKLRKELEKRSDEISRNQARIEALDTHIKEMSKSIKDLRDLLGKIKDVKNLVKISNEMGKTLTMVEKERRSIAQTAGKIETIFSELSKRISEFDSYKDKVDFNAESMHDLMKSLDMLEIKLEGVLKKEDMSKIDERIKKIETEVKDDVQDMKDIVGMLVSSLKKTSLKGVIEKQDIESVADINDRVNELQRRIEAIEGLGKDVKMMGSDVEALKRGADYMRTKIEVAHKERKKAEKKPVMAEGDALSGMVNYVRSCLDLGYTTKQIKKELLSKGWPNRTVNETILREVIRRRKQLRAKRTETTDRTMKELKAMVKSPEQ